MDRFLTSEKNPVPLTERILRTEPELILAVGLDALKALEDIHEIPIVFVMSLSPERDISSRVNVTGVNMTPSVDVQLGRIRDILPDIHRIGVVFDPEQTGQFVEKASLAAGPLGIDILASPAAKAREVPTKLADIRDQAQIIWMLPDVTVMTRQTVEFFLLFSLENRIPLIAFSEKYVDMGAFMAFVVDPEDMGRQAGEMANLILSGKSPRDVPIQDASSVSVTVNRGLAEKFDIQLNDAQLEPVKFVE
jgi:putative ABC transport system substrate-binding protein